THCRRYAFRAAIALCVCILAYPYAIVLFFVCLILLIRWDRRESHAAALLFTLCCMGLGLLFMAYILSGISVTQLWENLSYVLMDESHDQSLKQMWLTHIGTIGEMLLPTFLILLVSQASILADKGRAAKRRDLTVSVAAVAQSALFVAQFHTITKVNFTVFLPLICQLTLFLGYVCWLLTREDLSPADAKREDGEDTGNVRVAETDMILAMGLTGILGAVVVLSSSNLDANYSMGFLFTALLAVCLVTERILGRCVNVRGRMGFITVWAVRLTILVFGILLLVTRVFLVRFTSTQRKNIFEGYYETEHGPLGGIRLGEYDYRQYEAKLQALEEYVSEEDVFLYVGCDMFLYSGCDGRIGTGNTISTPAFGKQLLAYYDRYPERVPTVMFVDREYVADFTAVLKEEPFQSFVNAHYELDMTAQNLPIDVYRLTD
ncbi:MAG: hypothetical protein J6P60_05495, partial [Lachnospiraceae bacterium]|nr:hypothetical protein [Lachnospiraceae bacterium]